MKKKTFVNLINAITDQMVKEDEIADKLGIIMDGSFIIDITADIVETILESLEVEMNDPCIDDPNGSIIGWWLYDAPDAGKSKDSAWVELKSGKRIPLESPEQLYDYLTGDE